MNDPRGDPKGQYTRARHRHHEKPPHPDWQGTFNLDNLFENPEKSREIDSHCPASEVDYYCYSTSPNEGYKSGDWRSDQQGKPYY